METNIVIRANASLAMLAGALALLFAVALFAAMLLAPASPQAGPLPPVLARAAGYLAVLMFAAIAACGIASGVGVLQRRSWARVSMMVFAAVIAFFGATGFFIMILIPGLVDAATDYGYAQFLRAALIVFYGGTGAAGFWWLFLFSRADSRAYFEARPAPDVRPDRPLGVTLVAAWLLAGACAAAAAAALRLSIPILGVWVDGWRAYALYSALAALNIDLASGLIDVSERERVRAMGYLAALGANALVCAFGAGYLREVRAVTVRTGAAFQFRGAELPLLWVVAAGCCLGVALPIALLAWKKAAFR